MSSLPARTARTFLAGILGVVSALAIIAVTLVIGVVVIQSGLQWYARGSFMLLPVMAPASSRTSDVVVRNASPGETAAIRAAVSDLNYRVDPAAVTFGVIDQPICVDCQGDYTPAIGLIQLQRSVVDGGGPPLVHAVAHEIGHVVDFNYLNDAQRAQFRQLRGITSSLAWAATDQRWQDRPVEDFAEVFATLAVPTVVIPPETSYGRVRNPAAIQRLLATAGVLFDGSATQTSWRSVLAQELGFFKYTMENPFGRVLFEALIALYVVLYTFPKMRDAWRK